jgi:ssDNA-binding replication factor A large subunit
METQIGKLSNYQKNINLSFIVIKEVEVNKTKEGCLVRTYLVADESGSIEYSIWNEELNPGDIIRITNGYTTLFKNKNRLYNSKSTTVSRVSHFRKAFSLIPFMS